MNNEKLSVSGMRAACIHSADIIELVKTTSNLFELKSLVIDILLKVVAESQAEGFAVACDKVNNSLLELTNSRPTILEVIDQHKTMMNI